MENILKPQIIFNDRLDFKPHYTPVEMFKLGIFGNNYFKVETKDIPQEFLKELISFGYVVSKPENFKLNCYGVDCGSPLEWWQEKNLINPADPNGWVEWYIKFYYGRRHEDDTRQINRWKAFVARHMGMFNSLQSKNRDSLKTKQNLLQWSWNYNFQI